MTLINLSDEQLWSMVVNEADSDAFITLWDRHYRHLCALAEHHLKNRSAAQDIVQEVFVNIYIRRKELVIDTIGAYLAAAVVSTTLHYIRIAIKVPQIGKPGFNHEAIIKEIPLDKITESKELARTIEALIAKMPGRKE